MTTANWIAFGSLLIATLAILLTVYTRINLTIQQLAIKNTENYKDISSLRKEFEDNKEEVKIEMDNIKKDFRDDFKEVKDLLKENRDEVNKRFDVIQNYFAPPKKVRNAH